MCNGDVNCKAAGPGLHPKNGLTICIILTFNQAFKP